MTWQITDTVAGTQSIAATSGVANHPLGTIVRAKDQVSSGTSRGEGEFIYLSGVASTAVGSWVTYNMDAGNTTLLAAGGIGPVAVAMSANVAIVVADDTGYGWYQISGKAIGACLTQFADNGAVFITATGGSVDDTSVAGDLVNLAKGASTTTVDSGVADFEISRPFVDNREGNT